MAAQCVSPKNCALDHKGLALLTQENKRFAYICEACDTFVLSGTPLWQKNKIVIVKSGGECKSYISELEDPMSLDRGDPELPKMTADELLARVFVVKDTRGFFEYKTNNVYVIGCRAMGGTYAVTIIPKDGDQCYYYIIARTT